MKSFLRDLPIKQKLIALTMAISGVALLLGSAVFAAYAQNVFRGMLARDSVILADMFDDNIAPGLALNDGALIDKTLLTLGANPHIIAACVFDKQGAVIGSYRRPRSAAGVDFQFPADQPTSQRFLAERLDTFQDITLAGEVIGVVYIGLDLGEFRERMWRYTAIVGLLLVGCLLVSLVLASRLHPIISQPIEDLAQTVATVAAQKNYSVRAHKQSNDELGRLIDGFNEMLAQIQTRDTALQLARNKLEANVEERTKELSYERDLLRALLDSSPDAIYFKDEQSRFLKVSRAQANFFGRQNADELVGKTDFDFFAEEHARPAFEDEQEIIRTGRPLIGKVEREVLKDGQESWVLTSKMPFRDKEGRIVGTFGTSKNITVLKETETKLEQLHKQLLETSRQAGMAEVASNILHNVGNVLNSVNISTGLIAESVKKSRASSLARVVALLREHAHDLGAYITHDPNGKHVPAFLAELSEQLLADQAAISGELDSLRQNVQHIKGIVAMQQNYAMVGGVKEVINVVDLVEDSLRINESALSRHRVKIIREFEPVPTMNVEKHKILQILVNLVRNAKHACDESKHEDRRMTVRVADGDGRIKISVLDNGVGILPENLTRIFGHGFTTRKGGHGFGLHSSALAAKEMDGSLNAQSDGPGLGATFTLELPCPPQEHSHE